MELEETGSGEKALLNCTIRYDSTNYKILAALRASAGLISFLSCALVIFIIILFKKYKFFPQRLVLNVAVAAMIHSLTYTTARVNYYTVRPIEDRYCDFGGLANHYTAAVELISIWCITINIFSVGMRGKNTAKLEPLFVALTYGLPVLWFWIPIWKSAYGTAGGWCGIKFLQEDCTPFPLHYLVFGIWYVPLYISTLVLITMMVLVVVRTLYRQRKWRGKYDIVTIAARQAIRDELKPLIWYPIIYMLLNSFSFISQIYNAIFPTSPSPVLPYLRVLSSPFGGAVVALAFALDRTTRRRLTKAQCKAACLDWCGDRTEIRELEESTLFEN